MRLLVLGGTVFLGRHLVGEALARGHQVTLFNRGQHGPELFPEAERLRGDRDGDLEALRGRTWDAAIDTSGYVPRVVRASAELLADAVGTYAFVSSISVYRDFSRIGMDETAPVATLEDETTEEVTGETYGALKALCEREVERTLPGRALIVRPGLIVGPHDPTGRFTYWPTRVARGGEVLAPTPPERPVQIIDGRDLAAWMLTMVERRAAGVYQAAGPAEPLTLGALLDTCAEVCRTEAADSDARITWVDEAFLQEHGVGPWVELPLWIPSSDESERGLDAVDCGRAIGTGLTFRPLSETVRDTLRWDVARRAAGGSASAVGSGPVRMPAGLEPAREEELLRAWHERG
ncbi:MAG TPA: NAD-dependent epimerase/dehydratase family protein [Ktedonobacterales bacterium]|nr:NAD-dependent epimerase/dehydratase family protein [Ktedonobacterales bacterium]